MKPRKTRRGPQGDKQASPGSLPTSRRQALLGLAAAAGGAVALSLGKDRVAAKTTDAEIAETTTQDQVAAAPVGGRNLKQRQNFYGVHQSGIVNPRPANGMIASFDVIAETPQALETLFRKLTDRIVFLMHGGEVPKLDPRLPPADSGILGPFISPDNLTVTVSLGESLFEERSWLKPLKPKRLVRMTQFPNDALQSELCHGDLALQFCANLQDTNIHALRDIAKALPEFLVLRWKQEGNVPEIPPPPGGRPESARNFLGFRDGSANPDSNDAALMDRIVWVTEGDDEPDWAHGGSYQAIRIIRNFVERWDRTPLQEQELIIGRRKMSGAPLGGGDSEFDSPDFANDPEGKVTPLDAHIRLANPRTPQTEENIFLRRPFNYSNGVTRSGQLDQGLLFIAYQADLVKGFITVQNRLGGEPLEEYIKPVGGGFFYVLPGVRDADDYLGRPLIKAVTEV